MMQLLLLIATENGKTVYEIVISSKPLNKILQPHTDIKYNDKMIMLCEISRMTQSPSHSDTQRNTHRQTHTQTRM